MNFTTSICRRSASLYNPRLIIGPDLSTIPNQFPRLYHSSLKARGENETYPPHLLTLADLSIGQIQSLVSSAINCKKVVKEENIKSDSPQVSNLQNKILDGKTIALIFGKRSTRTRVASESATVLLGGHPMFLSPSDIQLGVNESLFDTAKVVSSMVDGIMARVGDHSEVEVSVSSIASYSDLNPCPDQTWDS